MASSLDTSVRIWTRFRPGVGWWTVETRSLSEDVAQAVRDAQQRWRSQAWQRRKRLKMYAVPGVLWRLEVGRRVRLLTLPYPGATMAQVAGAWNLLRRRIERRTGELEFCGTRAIGGRTGNPHAHVLCDWGAGFIDQVELAEWWFEITGYRVVDVRMVKSAGAAEYVAANVAGYVSDQAGGRMFRSRGWTRAVCS